MTETAGTFRHGREILKVEIRYLGIAQPRLFFSGFWREVRAIFVFSQSEDDIKVLFHRVVHYKDNFIQGVVEKYFYLWNVFDVK
jgi:hypothetical protein